MVRKSTGIVHGCNAVSYTQLNEEKDECGEYIKNGCRRLKASSIVKSLPYMVELSFL